MALEAVGHGVQQARPAAGADLRHQARGGGVHRFHIVAVHLQPGHAQSLRPRRHAGAGRHGRGGRGGRDAVVLTDEQHGQPVDLRPVQTLQEGPAVGRAVAKEAGDDVWQAADLQRMRRTRGNGDARGHHAVGAQHAHREVGNVHGAALALVVARGAAEQLAHHACGVRPLGQGVAVPAVGGSQQVFTLQVEAHARSHGLLPGGQVQRSAHQRGLGGGCQAPGGHAALAGHLGRILEGADAAHRPVQVEQSVQ